MNSKQLKKTQVIILIMISVYLIVQLSTLTGFPYIHSDESWLSGFSRTVLEKGTFKTQEPFFDLYPRAIHGLRVVFVSLQMGFIKLFGYTIFSLRLMALLFSTLSLLVVYKYFRLRQCPPLQSTLMVGVMGMMNQFFLMSHTARQEPIILFGMVLAFYFAQQNSPATIYVITAIIGLCIGVHPNSFLIGCGIGLIYLYKSIAEKRSLKPVLQYTVLLGSWALLFVGISFWLNPNFIKDYLAFGSQLGVVNHSINRFDGFYYYYYKLYEQIGGTYVLLNIKFNLIITLLSIVASIIVIIRHYGEAGIRPLLKSTLMLVGINIGLLVIGRYNQTAVIFTLIFGWILFFDLLLFLNQEYRVTKTLNYMIIGALLTQCFFTYSALVNVNYQDYSQFGEELKAILPSDAKVLGNLNMDYHLELYQLYDVRNLNYLESQNLSLENYIKKNDITYVVLYDEMTYIHDAGGKWDILYGDLDYYEDMMAYLSTKGELIATIDAPTYGMRIAKYVDVYPWQASVYELK